MKPRSLKKQLELAEEVGRKTAEHFFTFFRGSKNRGPKFEWPKTLRQIVVSSTKMYAESNEVEEHTAVAVASARRTLNKLLAEERQGARG